MLFLFSKGLVFTTHRIRDWETLIRNHDMSAILYWRYISSAHNGECLRILNTNCIHHPSRKLITWNEYVKDILPLL